MLKLLILIAQCILLANCYTVEIVRNDVKPIIGESPHWDADTNSLYYIDLFSNGTSIYRYDFGKNRIYSASIPNESGMPGFIMPIEGRKNKYAVGLGRDVKVIKWDGESPTAEAMCTQFTMDADILTNRIHDSHADPYGNFYGGTTRAAMCNKESKMPSGNVYKSTDGKPTELVFGNIDAPNAMQWNTKKNKTYFTHTCAHKIIGYDWDPETTALSNPLVVLDLRKALNLSEDEPIQCVPDGLAIDTEGILYSAIVNASTILKFDPATGEVLEAIKLPVPNVQAVAFGGPNLDILFAVTSNFALSSKSGTGGAQKLPPDSGNLFMIKGLGVKGFNGKKLRKSFASCAPEKDVFDEIKGKTRSIFKKIKNALD